MRSGSSTGRSWIHRSATSTKRRASPGSSRRATSWGDESMSWLERWRDWFGRGRRFHAEDAERGRGNVNLGDTLLRVSACPRETVSRLHPMYPHRMRNVACALLLALGCAHMTQVTSIQGPQGRLHVEDGGRGSLVPVLFVHGNGANLTQWRAQLDHLRLTRRAVAFDLRGMGQSDVPADGDYSVSAMVDDVQSVADALHLKRFVIVGHSYGGTVVGAYAARHPERVAGVVFADASGTVKFTDEAAAKFLTALRADKDGFTHRWFAPILKSS